MRFSERHGYRKVRDSLQVESMDDDLRNSLWNALTTYVWSTAQGTNRAYALLTDGNRPLRAFAEKLWVNHYKFLLDELSMDFDKFLGIVRFHFMRAKWYDVYDLMEFIAAEYRSPYFIGPERFRIACNQVLEREKSGYRFVDGVIAPITNANEMAEIEQALDRSSAPVETHLQRALALMSDRVAPDYRNSVKESISAIESMVVTTLGEKGTLGQLVKKLQDEIGLHGALASAFSSLYGYTSDAGGIRHALTEEGKPVTFDDAKFFLVTCSAFVNFVTVRVAAVRR